MRYSTETTHLQIPRFEKHVELKIPRFKQKKSAPMRNLRIGALGLLVILVTYFASNSIMPKLENENVELASNYQEARLESLAGRVAVFQENENVFIVEIPENAVDSLELQRDYRITFDEGRVVSIITK